MVKQLRFDYDQISIRLRFRSDSHATTVRPRYDHSTTYVTILAAVEQALKNWEGKKLLQLPLTIPVCPRPLIGGTCPFCPLDEAMHAVTVMSMNAIGL